MPPRDVARVKLPEGLATAGLTNVPTGEPVSVEDLEGTAVVRAAELLRGFPVALLVAP